MYSTTVIEETKELRLQLAKCEGIRQTNNGTIDHINENPMYYFGYGARFLILQDTFYQNLLGVLEEEADILNDSLAIAKHIYRLKRKAAKGMSKGIRLSKINCIGTALPLWTGGKPAPPLCGCIPASPNHIAGVGNMVATKVKLKNKETNKVEDLWILTRVLQYNDNGTYEVEDMYDETKVRAIKKSHIIPLPLTGANPKLNPEALFKKDTVVLAIYPQLTTFYPAKVKEPPKEPTDFYKLLFKDSRYDEINDGYDIKAYNVCQRFVIKYPAQEKRKDRIRKRMFMKKKRKHEALMRRLALKHKRQKKTKTKKLTRKRTVKKTSVKKSHEIKGSVTKRKVRTSRSTKEKFTNKGKSKRKLSTKRVTKGATSSPQIPKAKLATRRVAKKATSSPRLPKEKLTTRRVTKGSTSSRRLPKERITKATKEGIIKRRAVKKRHVKSEDGKRKLPKSRTNSKKLDQRTDKTESPRSKRQWNKWKTKNI